MKMVITAGGTGGHIYPALAIIDYFKKQEKDFEVLYIGTHNRMETKIVPEKNIPYKGIKIYGFSKKDIKRDFLNIGYIIKSYNELINIFKEFSPDVVVGVGGYVTFPVILAAKKCHIKTVIHEQNSIPGKTNKFLSKGVDKVFLSFKESEKYFKKGTNLVYTGNPSGDSVLNSKRIKKETLGFSSDKKFIIITSGSLGSSTLNKKLIEFLKLSKDENYEVLFITGESNYETITKSNKFSKNIKVVPYFDNLSHLLSSSDLIITRAGASTISEIINAKVPAILIPSPYVANNHQYYNALDLYNSNKALMIEEKELDSNELYKKVVELLKNNNKEYAKIKNNLLKEKSINSSEIIYKEIKELINESK